MQREIKFRGFCKDTVDYLYSDTCGLAHFFGYVGRGDWIIQQYTGLKDSKGREIYEGDIISNLDGVDYVYYKNGCFWVDDQWLYDHASNNEIIGNIFENPELLKV